MHHRVVLPAAQDQADRLVLARHGHLFAGVVEVQVHLPRVGVAELAELQVEDDQAAEPAVEQDEVHAVPLVADAYAPLAGHEGEGIAHFQEKRLHVADDRLLEVALAVLVLEVQELEQVRIAYGLFEGDGVFGPGLLALAQHSRFVARQGGALEELRAYLPVGLPHGPGAANGLVFVEPAGEVVGDGHEVDVVRPGQREEVERRGGRIERKLRGNRGL